MPARNRWAVVAILIGFVGLVELVVDSVLDPVLPFPQSTIVVVATFAVVATLAARWAFNTIDRLTGAIVQRNAELEGRNAALRALYAVSLDVSRHADPQQTIASIASHARTLVHVDGALIVLREGDAGLCLQAGDPPTMFSGPACGVEHGEIDRVDAISAFLPDGVQVVLDSPITRGGEAIGYLALASRSRREFGSAEREMLDALATQAGIALEAAHLHQEIQALAIRGERARIAREMHDGLAQVLGYVNTKSQAVEGLLEASRTSEARAQLTELAAAARSVYVDVREAILNLTAPSPEGMNLGAALEDYASRYAESSKLAVRTQVAPDAAEAPVSAATKAEVFRIVREALTNVRKHASANRVLIAVERDERDLIVRVADDGRGFDPSLVGVGPENWPHFGLAGMRERAATVGGRIEWRSNPGSGTEIELHVPLLPNGNWGRTNAHPGDGAHPVEGLPDPPGAPPVQGVDRLVSGSHANVAREGD